MPHVKYCQNTNCTECRQFSDYIKINSLHVGSTHDSNTKSVKLSNSNQTFTYKKLNNHRNISYTNEYRKIQCNKWMKDASVIIKISKKKQVKFQISMTLLRTFCQNVRKNIWNKTKIS